METGLWIQFDMPSSWSAAFHCEKDARAKGSKSTKKSELKVEIYESGIIQPVKLGDVSHGNGTEN